MRPRTLLLAAFVLLGSHSAYAATKETYAHKMEMGNLLFFNGDSDRAIKAFQRAGELKPDAFEPHLNLVNLWVQKGGDEGIEQAEAEARKVIQIKPGHRDAHLILGNLLRNQAGTIQDKEKANVKLEEAAKEVAAAENLGAAPALCENTIGLILLQKGDTDEALKHINTAVAKQPIFPDAHLVRAVLMFKNVGADKAKEPAMKAKVDEVLAELDLAIKQKPKNAEAHYTKAQIFFAAGRMNDAIKEYEAATKDEPKYLMAWAELGSTSFQQWQAEKSNLDSPLYAKAKNAFEQARKLKPEDRNIVYLFPILLEKADKKDEAVAEFNKSLENENDATWRQNILAHIAQLQGGSTLGLGGMVGVQGTVDGGAVGSNIFTSGALSQPFASLIKLEDPKNKQKTSSSAAQTSSEQ